MDLDNVFIDGVSEMCNVNSIEVKHIATDSVKLITMIFEKGMKCWF